MPGFDTTYRTIADVPPGDAASAQRAVAADGTEVIVKTVAPTDAPVFTALLARLVTSSTLLERVLGGSSAVALVALTTQPVPGEGAGSC